MKCPFCSEDMEQGVLESTEPINFLKEARFVNRTKKDQGEFNLVKPPFGGQAALEVWLCRDCRKIVISY